MNSSSSVKNIFLLQNSAFKWHRTLPTCFFNSCDRENVVKICICLSDTIFKSSKFELDLATFFMVIFSPQNLHQFLTLIVAIVRFFKLAVWGGALDMSRDTHCATCHE